MDQLTFVKLILEPDLKSGNISDRKILYKRVADALESYELVKSKMGLKRELTDEEVLRLLEEQLKDHLSFLDNVRVLQTQDVSEPDVKFDGPRWAANRDFLISARERTESQLANLQYTTNIMLGHMMKSFTDDEFYVKGMVYKEVQSGKTEHFASLINLAIDNGYELIIVLTGSQNDLRSQTQIRIDSDVIGQKTIDDDRDDDLVVGIGNYFKNSVITHCLTDKTSDGDINSSKSGMRVVSYPVVIVTKKNHDNLKALIKLLRNNRVQNRATLIIDDEADQASIDTHFNINNKKARNKGKDPSDPEYVPSSINAHIRKLIKVFNRKSYVAYTATPFANLLIKRNIEHPEYGPDLYPKDFILAIPSEDGYIGPKQWFGENGLASKLIATPDITPKSFADYVNEEKELPSSLKKAIKCFIIATSIRRLREGTNEHNSMLIHTEMSNKVQNATYNCVKTELELLNRRIAKGDTTLMVELEQIYDNEFVPTTLLIMGEPLTVSWAHIRNVLPEVTRNIEPMMINGESEDTLNYEEYKDRGLYVIAVGGNKLSRGITLDGLTISYYLRQSRMQDTLTQMGRWCGYKAKYLDVCRLYTTKTLIVSYAKIVKAIDKLMEDLTEMHYLDVSPQQYQLELIEETDDLPENIKRMSRGKGNVKLKLTSRNKSRSALRVARRSSLSGQLFQDTSFYADGEVRVGNQNVISSFLHELPWDPEPIGSNRIWRNLQMQEVVHIMSTFRTPSNRYEECINYINNVQLATHHKELSKCTVVLLSNKYNNDSERIGKFPINRMSRNRRGLNHLQSVTTVDDEFIDLMLSKTDLENLERDEKVRKRPKDQAVLLIYPVKTETVDNQEIDILCLAMSFPKSDAATESKTTYVISNV